MNQALSDFAARWREIILSEGRVSRGPDVEIQNEDNGDSGNWSLQNFNSLALELFALQFRNNPAYRTICQAKRVTPETAGHWTQIPAVPTSAFKELELSCIPPEEQTAVFHSSGTTEQKPSRHFHCRESMRLYEDSLWSWFEQSVLADLRFTIYDLRLENHSALRTPHCAIFLTPPPEQAPHSSLVHMFETIHRKLGAPASAFVGQVHPDGAWTLNFDALLAAINSSLIIRHPSLLLGTAFSFVHLLDFLAAQNLRFDLPPGSRVMETGGYKNRSRVMPKAELHARITERLGVPAENIICEYGMSELSSQAYDRGVGRGEGGGRNFCFPPWARAQIVSPETGREVADGETGLIRVFDLANVFSVAAIQTEDLAIRRGAGFELIGRAQLAEPRGCSLTSHSALRIPHSALK